MNKTLAIVGSHTETREQAPWDDQGIDIWVFNEATMKDWCKRLNASFQMHIPLIYMSTQNRNDPNYPEWLQQAHGKPIYMQDIDERVPDSVRYPLEEVLAFTGGAKWFTSSIAYALALAIYLRYERVMLYGIEMASNTEYFYQRICVTYWLGIMAGKGIQVDLYSLNEIFDAPLYGYEGVILQDGKGLLTRQGELLDQENQARKAKRRAENDLDDILLKNKNPEKELGVLSEAANQLGQVTGALVECTRYIGIINSMIAEAGMGYIDRNQVESAAALQRKKIEEEIGPAYFRTAGRIDYVLTAWLQTGKIQALQQLRTLIEAHITASQELGYGWGVYNENDRLAKELDKKIRSSGGEKALEIIKYHINNQIEVEV